MERARKKLAEKYVDAVLMVVSVIQGLAFSSLATKINDIVVYTKFSGDYIPLCYFGFSFIILLRVFQSLLTAALDYGNWNINFADMFLIFGTGALEYFVFSSLTTKKFDPVEFHWRVSLISVFAAVGYMRTYFKVRKEVSYTEGDLILTQRLQRLNILGAILVLLISILVMVTPQRPLLFTYATVVGCASMVVINISYSLYITFGVNPDIKSSTLATPVQNSTILVNPAAPPTLRQKPSQVLVLGLIGLVVLILVVLRRLMKS